MGIVAMLYKTYPTRSAIPTAKDAAKCLAVSLLGVHAIFAEKAIYLAKF